MDLTQLEDFFHSSTNKSLDAFIEAIYFPSNLSMVSEINNIIMDEIGIEDFIPQELVMKEIETRTLAYENKSSLEKKSFLFSVIDVFAQKHESSAEKKQIKNKIKTNIKVARRRLNARDQVAKKRMANKLMSIDYSSYNDTLQTESIKFKIMLLSELGVLKSTMGEILNKLNMPQQPNIPLNENRVWNATLKEAAGIVRNNYYQDQLLPPDKRKYKYLLDASNEFFNSHDFPVNPNLNTESFYENVKKYK